MNKTSWFGLALGITALVMWSSKRTLSAEGDVKNESLVDKIISGLIGDKKEEVVEVPKPIVYDYGSIELPEPVMGMSGRAYAQSSLEPSASPISSIGQNSSGRVIGGY
jgi:hypothetical protein